MKIVFLSDDFPPRSFGGAGISTYELAAELRRQGHDLTIITTCRKQHEAGESNYQGLRIFSIASDYPGRWRSFVSVNNRRVVGEVERLLRELRPEVVHAHNIHQHLSFASLRAARRHARKVFFTARDTMAITFGKLQTARYLETLDPRVSWLDELRQSRKRYNPLRAFFVRRYLACADQIFAISKSLKYALEQNGIKDVEVVYNGIDVSSWEVEKPALVEFRNKHGLEGKKVLLFSGRLSSQKGGAKALEALARILPQEPQAVLLVAGAVDEYARAMQAYAKELGVAEQLVFTGWLGREDMKLAYAAADVVFMLSLYLDAFGRVNIEAMAARKPVVGTRYGGTPEIVADQETGYIIDPRDPEEIARKALELLRNPERARAFGEAGYKRALSRFSLESAARVHLEQYAKVG